MEYKTLLDKIAPGKSFFGFFQEDSSSAEDIKQLKTLYHQLTDDARQEISNKLTYRANELFTAIESYHNAFTEKLNLTCLNVKRHRHTNHVAMLINALVEFHPMMSYGTRHELLQRLIHCCCLSSKTLSHEAKITQVFRDFNQEMLTPTLYEAVPLLFANIGEEVQQIAEYLNGLAARPCDGDKAQARRHLLIERAAAFLHGREDAPTRLALLKVINRIPYDKLDAVYAAARHIADDLPTAATRVGALMILSLLPPSEYDDALLDLLKNVLQKVEKVNKLYQGLHKVDYLERTALLRLIAPLYQNSNAAFPFGDRLISFQTDALIEICTMIPAEQRNLALAQAIAMLLPKNRTTAELLNAIPKIAPADRATTLMNSTELDPSLSPLAQASAVRTLSLIPAEDQSPQVITQAQQLFSYRQFSNLHSDALFNTIESLDPLERAQTLLHAGRHFSGVTGNLFRAIILLAISSKGNSSFFNDPPAAISNIKDTNRRFAAQAFYCMTQSTHINRNALAATLALFQVQSEDFSMLLLAFCQIPPAHRTPKVIHTLLELCHCVHSYGSTPYFLINLIDPTQYEEAAELLMQPEHSKNVKGGRILESLMSDPSIRDKCITHTFNTLSLSWSTEQSQRFCDHIINNRSLLGLQSDDEPLMQLTFARGYQCLPHPRADLSNPYINYHFLRQADDSDSFLDIPPTTETVAQTAYRWDGDTIRQKGRPRIYNAADLPAEVEETFFIDYFKGLRHRYSELTAAQRSTIDDEIHALIMATYTGNNPPKKNNWIAFLELRTIANPFIGKYLKEEKDPSTAIAFEKYMLFLCIKQIIDSAATPLQNGLSERDYQVIKFANSMQECEVGQLDSLNRYFHEIPPRYRAAADLYGGKDVAGRASAFIEVVYQDFVKGVFDDPELLSELTGTPTEKRRNDSHQSLYLYNRFGRHLGMRRRVQFDRYATVVAKRLLNDPYLEQFKAILSKFSINSLVRRLLERSPEGFDDFPLYQGMSVILAIPAHELHQHGYINYEEGDHKTTISLTEKGAALLLTTLGYIAPAETPITP